MADWRWGEQLWNFERNENMFWKEVKRVTKGGQARGEMEKDVNGKILRDGIEIRRRFAEYFERGTECGRYQGRKYKSSCR